MAIDDFAEAIEQDPELPEGYYRRGMSKYSCKMYKDAIKDFKIAYDKEDKQMDMDPSITDRNAGIENGLA